MSKPNTALDRIHQLRSFLTSPTTTTFNPTHSKIHIGDTSIPPLTSQSILEHLKWFMEKDLLGQDIFIIGPPGPFRRHLVLAYLNLVHREMEYVVLHRDISAESDLKQRREIVRDEGGVRALWVDGVAVRAAIEGRVLVIEGIEKAERNVLPVLNNLLENREMNLEDGRHIIHPSRYDTLLQHHSRQQLDAWNLVRASENFRVIALGTPVPPYPGNPLDPPFRSRFQVRYVDVDVGRVQGGVGSVGDIVGRLGEVAETIKYSHVLNTPLSSSSPESSNLLPHIPQTFFQNLLVTATYFPQDVDRNPLQTLTNLWPSSWISKPLNKDQTSVLVKLMRESGVKVDNGKNRLATSVYTFVEVVPNTPVSADLVFESVEGRVRFGVAKGPHPPTPPPPTFIPTPCQTTLLSTLLQCHTMNRDICLVGPPASGKTSVVERFAEVLGYEVETVHLFRDMTARDLVQRRGMRDDGRTCWQNSGLVEAALTGRLAVLDGVQWLAPGTLASLQRLTQDRAFVLPDGTTLQSAETFDRLAAQLNLSQKELEDRGVLRIHPSFRIIATANVGESGNPWMTEEIENMFLFVKVEMGGREEEEMILKASPPTFRTLTQGPGHHLSKTTPLSTRQLIRIAKRVARTNNVGDMRETIKRSCLSTFLPVTAKKALEDLLDEVGVEKMGEEKLYITRTSTHLDIGGIQLPLHNITEDDQESRALIPSSHTSSNGFHENPLHLRCLRDMAIDFGMGEHLLVIGNQGVGKNKLTDRFLELLGRPREYIQLHRDTTVSSLTISTSIENGIIVYSDSPLIRAVKKGRVIVIDEADKAPVTITAILKSLAETGEMTLADGRKVRRRGGDVEMHEGFRMIVLANRPGYPFMGNDFFKTVGEVFACHPVENPDPASELALLTQLAPTLNPDLLKRLIAAFNDLRTAFDDNLITYPYSLRELLNLVRHMQRFPSQPLSQVLRNVFDFDVHRNETMGVLRDAFRRHGIQVPELGFDAVHRGDPNAPKLALRVEMAATKPPPEASDPKHGKLDPNNDPHIGGNQWAGGTGGSDTAGLGGRGGPYRLDSGNPIHQLSDEDKAKVPPHVLERARGLGRQALEARLKEIKMSSTEGEIYGAYSGRVRADVARMKVVLEGVRDRKNERSWIRNRSDGELDDGKLVEEEPDFGMERGKPKRLKLVFDVSGSMYRFNGYDGRLTRCLETALMIMESLQGMEDRYLYDIVGHMLESMAAHSQYCWSGDSTVAAARRAVKEVVNDDADDYFVIILSGRQPKSYGITAPKFPLSYSDDRSTLPLSL
ncbi:AAA domain-containing protein [Chytridium lagenaria]|nr:AAA domain-containing protein [Chytridium lagenaria]